MAADKKTVQELLDLQKQLNVELDREISNAKAMRDYNTARALEADKIAANQRIINELRSQELDLTIDERKQLIDIEKKQKDINTQLNQEKNSRQRISNILGEANRQLKLGWQYLQQSDKIIRQTILNLGLSGTKAEMMRSSFEQSAGFVARIGGSLEDVQGIMTGYADETGRARVLSAEMVKDIALIGKGTGLGIEQATRLGAQFELMGFDAKSTMDYVQGVVDTTERMGVNTTKVLKVVNDNFKKLNTYTFQQGVKGFAQMASYAEKFRIDITQALSAADVAKNLEGAIGLAAQLQVMGGEFAKTDPFEMLFLARNDPAKFTEKIADMTKGVVTFRKMADGSFEKFISPADRDRLAAVAKSLGMEASELTQIAERQAEVQKMRQQMAGMGITKSEKELIEGAAIFNKQSGRFEVMLAGRMKDVATLSKEQANSFVKESKSLEARALEAQTFEDAFKATINELKSALLPILRAVNGVLVAIRPTVIKLTEFFTEGPAAWAKVAALFLGVGVMWKGILQPFMQKMGAATIGKVATRVRGGVATPTGVGGGTAGGGMMNKISGKAMAGAGAGIGAAALGVGAGIGAAAAGISLLANAMSKLDEKQAETLKSVVKTLGWFILGGVGVAIAIAAIGAAGGAVAVPLIAFGGAIALIGAGIGIAAAGIGFMGMGLAKLVENSKGAGEDMPKVALGIAGIAASMGMATLALPGAIGMSLAVRSIGKHAPALAQVGAAFKEINTTLSGSKENFLAVQNAVESISKMNVKGGGALSDLANMLKKPLKVEFVDKQVAVVSNITMMIDGQKMFQKTYNPQAAVQKHEDLRIGKG